MVIFQIVILHYLKYLNQLSMTRDLVLNPIGDLDHHYIKAVQNTEVKGISSLHQTIFFVSSAWSALISNNHKNF